MSNKDDERRYLDLLSISNPQDAYREIKALSSGLSDDDHLIRSCIFDMHAAVEIELRRILYHHMKPLLFMTENEKENEKTERQFAKMIERLSFMDVYRILRPILESWPYPDLSSIGEINDLRNAVAHSANIDKAEYKGRNPFRDPDAFAELYFDVWAVNHCMAKLFEMAIELPRWKLKKYREKFGEL